ncbi:hypothetical protein TNCV_3844301 [Trichonephila clavipes]|nr:hypothetical protein TNCV_3844301 [Trichonephila clavipes]
MHISSGVTENICGPPAKSGFEPRSWILQRVGTWRLSGFGVPRNAGCTLRISRMNGCAGWLQYPNGHDLVLEPWVIKSWVRNLVNLCPSPVFALEIRRMACSFGCRARHFVIPHGLGVSSLHHPRDLCLRE